MKFLAALGQIIAILTVSAGVAIIVGPAYLLVMSIVMLSCLILLHDSLRERQTVLQEDIDFMALAEVMITSFVLGLIWPAIPLILTLTWKRADGV